MKLTGFRFGLRAILGAVACCAVLFWAFWVAGPEWREYRAAKARFASKMSPGFVHFGEAVVNFGDGPGLHYLRVEVKLRVPRGSEAAVAVAVENNKPVLRDWLITHLSEKTLEEVRSSAGIDQIREEIRDGFNQLLLPDDDMRPIEQVLFQEFTIM